MREKRIHLALTVLLGFLPFMVFFVKTPYFNFRHLVPLLLIIDVLSLFSGKDYSSNWKSVFLLVGFHIFFLLFSFSVNIRYEKSLNILLVMLASSLELAVISRIFLSHREMDILLIETLIFGFLLSLYFLAFQEPCEGNIHRYTVRMFHGDQQDPNYFAALFLLPFSISISHLKPGSLLSGKKNTVLCLSCAALCAFCIIRTGSRATFATMGIVAFVVYLAYFRSSPFFLLIIPLLLILGVLVLPSSYRDRFLNLSSYVDESNLDRLGAWKTAMSLINLSPFFGNGFYSCYSLGTSFYSPYPMSVHDVYLEYAAEAGIFSLFALLILIFFPLFKKHDKQQVAVILSLLITSGIISSQISAFFWIYIYFLYLSSNQKEELEDLFYGKVSQNYTICGDTQEVIRLFTE